MSDYENLNNAVTRICLPWLLEYPEEIPGDNKFKVTVYYAQMRHGEEMLSFPMVGIRNPRSNWPTTDSEGCHFKLLDSGRELEDSSGHAIGDMPFHDKVLNDGNKIPAIAYGTYTVNLRGKDVHEYIELALNTGFCHIDTAQWYKNEQSIPIAMRESGLTRSDLYITTKYGGGDLEETIRASLKKLEIKQLDLYLIHWPTLIENDDYESIWSEFERFKREGLTKSIGVSNFTVEDLQKLLKIAHVKPAVNQIQLHPYNYAKSKPLLEYHSRHGIVTEAYGSLASITTFPGGPVDAAVEKAAKRLGITPTQVIFLWVKAKGAVIVTTSSSKQHVEQYFSTGDLPPLTEEEVAAIDAAGAKGTFKLARRKWLFTYYLTLLALFLVIGYYYHWIDGMQRSAS